MRPALIAAAALVPILALPASPASALDLNGFRAEHHRPGLTYSATLAGAAYEQAHSMARRNHLDHNGFRERVGRMVSGIAAENVLWGCDTQDCAIRMWAKSSGHRANMLRGDVSMYGIASATADNGRHYWVMELGN
jgi:uncharacterized protein YkwD